MHGAHGHGDQRHISPAAWRHPALRLGFPCCRTGPNAAPLQRSEPCWGNELLSSLPAPGAGWGLCLPGSPSAVISSSCSGSACLGTWQLETWGGDTAGSGGTGQAAQFGRRCWGTRTSQLSIAGAAAALSVPPSCCALSEHSAAGSTAQRHTRAHFSNFSLCCSPHWEILLSRQSAELNKDPQLSA